MEQGSPVRTVQNFNARFLELQMKKLRLMLYHYIIWLRQQWNTDALSDYKGLVISDEQADHLLSNDHDTKMNTFRKKSPESRKIMKSIKEIESKIQELILEMKDLGHQLPIDTLTHMFELNDFERSVLILCLALELDPSFERLFAYAQDDVNKKYLTPHLAMILLKGSDTVDLISHLSFHTDSPLRRHRLLHFSQGNYNMLTTPLVIDERISYFLRSIDRIDTRLTAYLKKIDEIPLTPGHQELALKIRTLIESEVGCKRIRSLNLIGPPGSGMMDIACAMCREMNTQLFSFDTALLPAGEAEIVNTIGLLEREIQLSCCAIILEAENIDSMEEKSRRYLYENLIKHTRILTFISSSERYRPEWDLLPVHVPKPGAGEQIDLWKKNLEIDHEQHDIHFARIIQQFDFGPRDIARASLIARQLAGLRQYGPDEDYLHDSAQLILHESEAINHSVPEHNTKSNSKESTHRDPEGSINQYSDHESNSIIPTLEFRDIWKACREQAGWHIASLAQQIAPCNNWDDIVLPIDILAQLKEVAAQVSHRMLVYETWGFGTKFSRGKGINALFSGPSGTGKTMAAEILANHLDLDLYRIDLAGVVSKYIGETEKNLRKVFDSAERSGAILFFDEADALFGKRTEVKDSHDRYANIEVNYLLQRMEDYRGLAILATNRKSSIDQAFLRRLRFLVDFPFPDAGSRRMIWNKIFPREAEAEKLDYQFLSRLEIPGGNIKNIALNAAFLAADNGGMITMEDIIHAARREYAKMDRMPTEAEFGSYFGKMIV